MAKSAQQVAQRWFAQSQVAGEAIRAGVQGMSPQDNPMEKAANSEQAWAQGVARAAANNAFANGCRKVSMQQWQAAMLSKGIANHANGLKDGQTKMQAFMADFLPYVEQGRQKLASMPRGTLEQNIARSAEMQRWNAAYKRS